MKTGGGVRDNNDDTSDDNSCRDNNKPQLITKRSFVLLFFFLTKLLMCSFLHGLNRRLNSMFVVGFHFLPFLRKWCKWDFLCWSQCQAEDVNLGFGCERVRRCVSTSSSLRGRWASDLSLTCLDVTISRNSTILVNTGSLLLSMKRKNNIPSRAVIAKTLWAFVCRYNGAVRATRCWFD